MGYRNGVEVGAAIAQLRRQLGLGQQEVARQLGIDQATMSRIERGLRSLRAQELYVLAGFFRVDPNTILRHDEPQEALLRAGGAGGQAVARGMRAFESLAREVLSARALEDLL
jgi:transcriptional regulator with XRE-family HTH domain